MVDRLTIRRPDDWHLHLRDGDMLRAVAPHSAMFGRAIVMPNLVPPVVTGANAAAYSERILAALPGGSDFRPLMTLYLTEGTDPDDVAVAHADGTIHAVKLYPAGATTNSASGVRDWRAVLPVLERMSEIGCPLLIHGEVTDDGVDVFDREAAFIERVLIPLREAVPDLKVTLEHVTTKEGVDYVTSAEGDVAGTITVQHLMLDRNDLLARHLRPHYYCLPILKRGTHREALRAAAATSQRFFLGTDSAPHPRHAKEAECCAAGCFTAPVALECLAHAFEEMDALDRLEAFTSLRGAARYGFEPNEGTVTLERCEPRRVGRTMRTAAGEIVVFDPGVKVGWRVRGE